MTTTIPTTTAPTTRSAGTTTHRRRWLVISAGALALVCATVAVMSFDSSDTDRPAVESVEPASGTSFPGPVFGEAAERHGASASAVDPGVTARGPASADAAERHAIAATSSCSGLPADAAERCVAAGR